LKEEKMVRFDNLVCIFDFTRAFYSP